MQNKKNRCAVYTRSATGDTTSLEAQTVRCRTAIRQAGWTIVDVRSDPLASGCSLCLPKREGLASLIAAAKTIPRPFDQIVIDDMSRLTRDLREAIELIEILVQYKVKIYCVAQSESRNDGLHLRLALDEKIVGTLKEALSKWGL